MNNAPAGAGWAAPAGFDPASAAGLKASSERRRANAGRSRSPEGGLFTSMRIIGLVSDGGRVGPPPYPHAKVRSLHIVLARGF